MPLPIVAIAATKFAGKKAGGELMNFMGSPEHRKKRKEQSKRILGATALAGIAAIGGGDAQVRAIEEIIDVQTITEVDSGKQEIVEFKLKSERHCWTAATIQNTGSSVKDETKVAGVSVGHNETQANMLLEYEICKDETVFDATYDPNTDMVTLNVPDRNLITTEINIVPGSLFVTDDPQGSYALSEIISTGANSLPLVQDMDVIEGVDLAQEIQDNAQANMAMIIGMKAAADNCGPTISKMAAPAIELGFKNIYLPGMAVKGESVSPSDITVLVEGEPIAEIEVFGEQTNIDEAFKKIVELDKDNDNFSFSSGEQGKADCMPPEEVQKIIDEANQLNAAAGRS